MREMPRVLSYTQCTVLPTGQLWFWPYHIFAIQADRTKFSGEWSCLVLDPSATRQPNEVNTTQLAWVLKPRHQAALKALDDSVGAEAGRTGSQGVVQQPAASLQPSSMQPTVQNLVLIASSLQASQTMKHHVETSFQIRPISAVALDQSNRSGHLLLDW